MDHPKERGTVYPVDGGEHTYSLLPASWLQSKHDGSKEQVWRIINWCRRRLSACGIENVLVNPSRARECDAQLPGELDAHFPWCNGHLERESLLLPDFRVGRPRCRMSMANSVRPELHHPHLLYVCTFYLDSSDFSYLNLVS